MTALSKSETNIDECISFFQKEETLNEWPCENCDQLTEHKMRTVIDVLPTVLLIRVKISNKINESKVKFKEKLNINSNLFELFGVIQHINFSSGKIMIK